MGNNVAGYRDNDRARLHNLFCLPLSFLSPALALAWNHMDATRIPGAAVDHCRSASLSVNVFCCGHRKYREEPECCGKLFFAGAIELVRAPQFTDESEQVVSARADDR